MSDLSDRTTVAVSPHRAEADRLAVLDALVVRGLRTPECVSAWKKGSDSISVQGG